MAGQEQEHPALPAALAHLAAVLDLTEAQVQEVLVEVREMLADPVARDQLVALLSRQAGE